MVTTRYQHKDTLFCRLFGSADRKGDALSLYNALAGTHYDDPAELEITTVEDTVYLGRKNDVSYLVGSDMLLVEHQSTHNPNMPLRGLHYLSALYAKLVVMRDLDVYGEDLLDLPTPRYVVLYFGTGNRPEVEEMKLSDSFASGPGALEVTATVLNCSKGMNRRIMESCKTLAEYARFVDIERANRKAGLKGREAVQATVEQCIEQGVLADYLTVHRTEVLDLLFTIEDEERAMRVHMQALEQKAIDKGLQKGMREGMREGLQKGKKEGVKEGLKEGLQKGKDEGRSSLATRLLELGVDESVVKQALEDTDQA